MTNEAPAAVGSLDSVRGWFASVDQAIFSWLLERDRRLNVRGDLLELGAYLGKSAILLGRHIGEGETLTVCDLFGAEAPDAANQRELESSYPTLTRSAFEANYLAFHDQLPTVIQAPTSVILAHVRPASCRFVHVDASHLYEHVRGDVEAARVALVPDGMVAIDDFRTEHAPGVAAATWEAVACGSLRPVCLTRQKFYGTWGDAASVQTDLLDWLGTRKDLWHETQEVAGARLVRVKQRQGRANAEREPTDAIESLNLQLDQAEQSLRQARRDAKAIRTSRSYRLGRTLTAPARAWRNFRRGERGPDA